MMRVRRLIFIQCLSMCIGVCLVFAQSALAASSSDQDDASVYDLPPSQVAIQPRKYEMSKSLVLTAGYIPTDSFNRGYTLSGSYRHAVTNYLTFEGTFIYVYNNATQLKSDLNGLGIQVDNVGLGGVLDYPRQIAMLGIHYAPFYSKSLLFNSKLVYSEDSFFLGVGSLNFNQVGYRAMIAPGIASRFYMGSRSAIVAYFRDYFYADEKRGIVGIIDFGIGFELKLGADKNSKSERSSDEADGN